MPTARQTRGPAASASTRAWFYRNREFKVLVRMTRARSPNLGGRAQVNSHNQRAVRSVELRSKCAKAQNGVNLNADRLVLFATDSRNSNEIPSSASA